MAEQIILENVMNHVLSGDALENALDFAAFLRANDFHFDHNPDESAESDKSDESTESDTNNESKWTGAIGGVVGDSIGYLYVNAGADFPDPWNIWLNEYDFDDDGSADANELKEFVWGNVNYCAKCNPDWENCGGSEQTVFGKNFDRLCHSPMFVYMPDAERLEKLKKLMLKIKEKRT